MFGIGVGVLLAVAGVGFLASTWQPASARLHRTAVGRLYWLGLVGAVTAGIAPLFVPSVPAPDDVDQSSAFSLERARGDIETIAARPHPMGSDSIETVRSYLDTELRAAGLEPVWQEVSAPDWHGGGSTRVSVVNVMARVPGTAPTGSVAVVAHYDTVPETPGANDDTSGVAIALEVARILAPARLRNDVIVLFTDGEEPSPRYGATAFAQQHEWFGDISWVVNLEAIGTGGPSWLTTISGPQSWVLDHYVDAVPRPAAYSFLTETTDLIGGSNSDFAVFRDSGVPGVEFVYGRGSSLYHTAADTPDSVSDRSLYNHGVNTVELVRTMAETDLAAAEGREMVFFTVGRDWVARYPASWALPVAALAGGAVVETARRRGTLRPMVRGAGTCLARFALAMALVTLWWMAVARWRNTMGAAESVAHLVVLAVLSTAIVRPGSAGTVGDRWAPEGVLLVTSVLAICTSAVAPGMSYLFVIPPLLGALALPFDTAENGGRPQLGPAVLSVGAWLLVLPPAIEVFHQFAQPRPGNPDSEVMWVIAMSVLLMALGAAMAWTMRPSSSQLTAGTVTGATVPAASRTGSQLSSG